MVKWMPHAQRQLNQLHEYIAQDSTFYAKNVTNSIVRRSLTLDELPRSGRVVPELGDANVRELPLYSYRLIYEIHTDYIAILAVIHKRQMLDGDDIPR